MFESMIQQIVPATWESFGVWIPLAFGLAVGLSLCNSIRCTKEKVVSRRPFFFLL